MAQQDMQQTAREERAPQCAQTDLRPVEDLIHYFREYARERPEMVAMACLGAGFILGWRLKPW
jgi:uncharacterized protein YijF (DUF1287 family)